MFENKVSAYFEKLRGKSLLVGFSGGKDSLAMLDFFNKNKKVYSFNLAACHVNHGIRSEASSDEDFCRDYCNSRSIKFIAKNVKNELFSSIKNGLEDAARRERYRALEEVICEIGADILLTAHTKSDTIESFFVDLFTGASIYTISGIARDRENILRPLIDVTSEEVEDYLKRNYMKSIFDRTNADINYVRNRVRLEVLPYVLKAGGDIVVNSIIRLQSESSRLNEYLTEEARRAIIYDSESLTIINKEIFNSFASVLKEFSLGKFFSEKFRVDKPLIWDALTLSQIEVSRRINLPDGYIFEVTYDSLKIFKKSLVSLFSVEKDAGIGNINILGAEVKFHGDTKGKHLTIRNRREGDRFMGKKLKDVFIDKKIGLFERDRAILAEEDGKIIWAEHISINDDSIEVLRADII